jgi:hypothetical protein
MRTAYKVRPFGHRALIAQKDLMMFAMAGYFEFAPPR